jgi:hypothetical protein
MQAPSGRHSSYPFLTFSLDGGQWSASRPGHALPPGKGPPVPTGQQPGWAWELVWTQRLEKKSFSSAGNRTPVIQSVLRYYTGNESYHYAVFSILALLSLSWLQLYFWSTWFWNIFNKRSSLKMRHNRKIHHLYHRTLYKRNYKHLNDDRAHFSCDRPNNA